MGERVISSLNTNWTGMVNGGSFTTVPDYSDLSGKADKSYVNKIESSMITALAEQGKIANEAIQTIEKRIKALSETISSKADKQAVKDILSESALMQVRKDIENLFAAQIQSIHDISVKEHGIIEKDITAFNNFANNANKELTSKLQPINDQFKNFQTRMDAIISGVGAFPKIQSEMDALRKKLSETQQRATELADLVEKKTAAMDSYVKQQLNAARPGIIDEVIMQLTPVKKKGLFVRLFSWKR